MLVMADPMPDLAQLVQLVEQAATPASGAGENLARLQAIRQLEQWLDALEREAIAQARDARCTWDEIGHTWGVSKQAASNRWGPYVRAREA